MNSEQIIEGDELRKLVFATLEDNRTNAEAAARADHKYTKAHAEAVEKAPDGTVLQKEAWVALEVEKEHLAYRLARATERVDGQAIRAYLQLLSYEQTKLKHEQIEHNATMAGQV